MDTNEYCGGKSMTVKLTGFGISEHDRVMSCMRDIEKLQDEMIAMKMQCFRLLVLQMLLTIGVLTYAITH